MGVVVVNNTLIAMSQFGRATKAMSQQVDDALIDSIQWQMLYGYHEPHGPDGHTEIYQTGDLMGSVETEKHYEFGSQFGWRITASANTYYASYVHNGTYKLNGRPFITDGVKRCIPEINGIIEKNMHG